MSRAHADTASDGFAAVNQLSLLTRLRILRLYICIYYTCGAIKVYTHSSELYTLMMLYKRRQRAITFLLPMLHISIRPKAEVKKPDSRSRGAQGCRVRLRRVYTTCVIRREARRARAIIVYRVYTRSLVFPSYMPIIY